MKRLKVLREHLTTTRRGMGLYPIGRAAFARLFVTRSKGEMDQRQIDRWEKEGIPKWFQIQLREVLVEEFGFGRGGETEKVLAGLLKGNKMDDDSWLQALKRTVPEYFLKGPTKDSVRLAWRIKTGPRIHRYASMSPTQVSELAHVAVERYSASPELAEALTRFAPEDIIRDIALADISGEFNPQVRVYNYQPRKDKHHAEKT